MFCLFQNDDLNVNVFVVFLVKKVNKNQNEIVFRSVVNGNVFNPTGFSKLQYFFLLQLKHSLIKGSLFSFLFFLVLLSH